MLYADRNFKSKKALREAVASGEQVTVYQPGGMFPTPTDGAITVGGPHFPEAHKWYAQARLADGVIVKGSVK